MNDPKQNTAPKPSRPEAVRVRMLKFSDPVDIPGATMPTSVKATYDATNTPHHEIQYEPWHRHHRVSWFEAGKDEPSRIVMVPEARVMAWEPG